MTSAAWNSKIGQIEKDFSSYQTVFVGNSVPRCVRSRRDARLPAVAVRLVTLAEVVVEVDPYYVELVSAQGFRTHSRALRADG